MFRQVVLHRSNARYRFPLQLCELVARHVIFERGTGVHRFQDFTGSEQEMGLLFEAFVRNYWKRHRTDLAVSAPKIAWDAAGDAVSLAVLPDMRTIVLSRPQHLRGSLLPERRATFSP